jgi:hypothetical protein
MWYVLILFFAILLYWNIFVEDRGDEEIGEMEAFLDIVLPIAGIAISAILGLIF